MITAKDLAELNIPGMAFAEEDDAWHRQRVYTLKGDGITIIMPAWGECKASHNEKDKAEWCYLSSCTTKFETSQGVRTFDRIGVENSFYLTHADTAESLRAKICEQICKVAESRARIARSITVPGLPGTWLVTPEKKEDYSKRLKAGQIATFVPAGFGTGYALSTRKMSGSTRGPAKLAEFFGVREIYYSTMDCD